MPGSPRRSNLLIRTKHEHTGFVLQEAAEMLKRILMTGLAEFMAFGLLTVAVAAWGVALAPVP
jgi:hypothetical protein